MLMLKNLFENFELAEFALSNWEYDKDTLKERLYGFRISSNAIYPFDKNGRLCFLRLAPMEEKVENNVCGEIEFLEYLEKRKYPSMRAIKAKSGETLLILKTPWGEYYASAFECVSGKPIEETEYTPHIMERYGEALGYLHSFASEYEPKVRKWNYKDALAWTEKIMKRYDAPAFMIEECRKIYRLMSALPADKFNYGLVHYDFEPDNVFYDEKTDCCSVIDFDDGMYNFYLLDIENVFVSLSEELEGEKLQCAKESFIKGYAGRFPLPDNYEQLLPLMNRFCNIFAYARLVRCLAEKPEEQPEWMTVLSEKLTRKLRAIENSCSILSDRIIRRLNREEITAELFDSFNRHQTVTKCKRKMNGKWVIVDVCFEENWDKQYFYVLADELKNTLDAGGVVFGAFENGILKGFASCEGTPMGSRGQYLELSIIQVSEEMRGSGMGRALFSEIRNWALSQGAEKLYISAHSSIESQAFYEAMGCIEAEEYSNIHVEKEPCDCQLEYCLKK